MVSLSSSLSSKMRAICLRLKTMPFRRGFVGGEFGGEVAVVRRSGEFPFAAVAAGITSDWRFDDQKEAAAFAFAAVVAAMWDVGAAMGCSHRVVSESVEAEEGEVVLGGSIARH